MSELAVAKEDKIAFDENILNSDRVTMLFTGMIVPPIFILLLVIPV